MRKRRRGLIFSVYCLTLAVSYLAFMTASEAADAEGRRTRPLQRTGRSVKNDLSAPLTSIIPISPTRQPGRLLEVPLLDREPQIVRGQGTDPVVQHSFSRRDPAYPGAALNIPAASQDFDGLSNSDNSAATGYWYLPPDTNGDVGLNHYVQWVNCVFAVYDRSGARLYGPAAGNTLWTGFGGLCETKNNGDPIALYDRRADRWLMSQFAFTNSTTGPFYQCIAVSQTGDPTGSWYRYAFVISDTLMNDYPKFGIWPDGYYLSVNQFNSSGNFVSVAAVAFERDKMLQGLPAQTISFDLSSAAPDLFGMLPSHLNGPDSPPPGSPNYYAVFDDDAWGYPADQLELWAFHVDWTTPANSTFDYITALTTAPFDSDLCGYNRYCVPQPDTSVRVAAISNRLMNRLQYRNFGAYEAMTVNHTVDAGDYADHAAVRWYELRNAGSGWAIQNQGTYSPDSDNRWMGSAAMDGMGNLAVGYSVSSGSTYPSVRYTGRLSTDAADLLPQGEGTIVAGGGSQTNNTYYRWGDYSSMSIDPTDDSTFWYTQQYYSATSDHGWQTRIGAFSLCSNSPSRTSGPAYWTTISNAYQNSQSVDSIEAQSVTFREDLDFNGGKTITMTGGFNCDYSAAPLRTTIIGSLTVSTGALTISRISIQ